MNHSGDFKKFLKEVILLLKDNIEDLKNKRKYANENEKEYIEARLLSYREIVANIRSQLSDYAITPEEIGLDKLTDIF